MNCSPPPDTHAEQNSKSGTHNMDILRKYSDPFAPRYDRFKFTYLLISLLSKMHNEDGFYSAVIESILTSSITTCYAAASAEDKSKLQHIIYSAEKVIGCKLPSPEDLYTCRSLRLWHKNSFFPTAAEHKP